MSSLISDLQGFNHVPMWVRRALGPVNAETLSYLQGLTQNNIETLTRIGNLSAPESAFGFLATDGDNAYQNSIWNISVLKNAQGVSNEDLTKYEVDVQRFGYSNKFIEVANKFDDIKLSNNNTFDKRWELLPKAASALLEKALPAIFQFDDNGAEKLYYAALNAFGSEVISAVATAVKPKEGSSSSSNQQEVTLSSEGGVNNSVKNNNSFGDLLDKGWKSFSTKIINAGTTYLSDRVKASLNEMVNDNSQIIPALGGATVEETAKFVVNSIFGEGDQKANYFDGMQGTLSSSLGGAVGTLGTNLIANQISNLFDIDKALLKNLGANC